MQQLLALRLAVILCHARRDPQAQGLLLEGDGQAITLRLPQGWASSYPQSAHLLREEVAAWSRTARSFLLAD